MKYRHLYILFLLPVLPLAAQSPAGASFSKAEELRKTYRFDQASEAYRKALEEESDPTVRERLEERILWCRNGAELARYICRPAVYSQSPVPATDFCLHLPPGQGAVWTTPPEALLQSLGHKGPAQAFLHRPALDFMVFAAQDSLTLTWDLYEAVRLGPGHWSAPEKLDTGINSPGNETYPVLSADGRTLWFASDGRGGMGGADIYCSRREGAGWSPAQNLGIPWSSPAQDLLFLPLEDHRSALLVSDRGTQGKNELTLYHLQHQTSPIQSAPQDLEELQRVAALPVRGAQTQAPDTAPEPEGAPVQDPGYAAALQARAQALEAAAEAQALLDTWRTRYTEIHEEADRKALERDLARQEAALWELQDQVRRSNRAVVREEERLLAQGRGGEVLAGLPGPAAQAKAPTTPGEEADPLPFRPEKGRLVQVDWGTFEVAEPEAPPVNLQFRKEKVAEFVTFDALPQELFYRIQVLSANSKVAASRLKGLSPAFEIRSGRSYIYHVGFFATYAEANKALAEVKRAGFSSAFVFAYHRGQRVSTQEARRLEAQGSGSYRILLGDFPQGLDADLREKISGVSNKDLSKSAEGGRSLYYLGPFGTRTEAQKTLDALHKLGLTETKIE